MVLRGLASVYMGATNTVGLPKGLRLLVPAAEIAFESAVRFKSAVVIDEILAAGIEALEDCFKNNNTKGSQQIMALGTTMLLRVADDEPLSRRVSGGYTKGLADLSKDGYEGKVNQLFEVKASEFVASVNKNDSKEAKGLLKVGLTLLVSAFKSDHASIYDGLGSAVASGFNRAAISKPHLLQQLLNNMAAEFTSYIDMGHVEDARITLRAALHILLLAIQKGEKEMVPIFCQCWINALHQDITHYSDRQRIIVDILSEQQSAIYTAISDGKKPTALDVSNICLELLYAALNDDNEEKAVLVTVLSECWVHALARAMETTQQLAKFLIDDKQAALFDAIIKKSGRARVISRAMVELVMTAMKLGRDGDRLAKQLSRAWVLALSDAEDKGYEGYIGHLVSARTMIFANTIRDDKHAEAELLSGAETQLLLAAITENKPSMVSHLSSACVTSLRTAMSQGSYHGSLDNLLKARTESFFQTIIGGNTTEIMELSKAGVILLREALQGDSPATVDALSKAWTSALSRAIDEGHSGRVQSLLKKRSTELVTAIRNGDYKESEALFSVETEMLLAAIEARHRQLLAILSKSLASTLADAIVRDSSMAKKLIQFKKRQFESCLTKDRTSAERVSKVMQAIKSAAVDLGNPAVIGLMDECWGVTS